MYTTQNIAYITGTSLTYNKDSLVHSVFVTNTMCVWLFCYVNLIV